MRRTLSETHFDVGLPLLHRFALRALSASSSHQYTATPPRKDLKILGRCINKRWVRMQVSCLKEVKIPPASECLLRKLP